MLSVSTHDFVMAELVPAIHVVQHTKDVHARDKPRA
jgi:hypothetical protein